MWAFGPTSQTRACHLSGFRAGPLSSLFFFWITSLALAGEGRAGGKGGGDDVVDFAGGGDGDGKLELREEEGAGVERQGVSQGKQQQQLSLGP